MNYPQNLPTQNTPEKPKVRAAYTMTIHWEENKHGGKPFYCNGNRENANADGHQQIRYLLYYLSRHHHKIKTADLYDNSKGLARGNKILIFGKGVIVSHQLPDELVELIDTFKIPKV